MNHTYEYRGFNIDVSVEADFSRNAGPVASGSVGFAAIVKIRQVGAAAARFSPVRFGEAGGKPFASEADALMGGFGAGRRMVDDLLTS